MVKVWGWESLILTRSRLSRHEKADFDACRAGLFGWHGHPQGVLDFQGQAIAHLRRAGQGPETLQTLSVALYNQAGYLAQVERFDQAVAAMEEVVAIDERLGLPDLESDRARLEQMRRRREGLPPAPPDPSREEFRQALQAQLEDLPPEAREKAQQFLQQLDQMSPSEWAAFKQASARQALDEQAEQIAAAARQAQQQNSIPGLLPQLEQAAAHLAQNETAGSPHSQLAQFIRAVIALLKNEALPPVPPAYAEKFAALQRDWQN